MDDGSKPDLAVIPTAADQMRAAFELLLRMVPIIVEAAPRVAQARKAMYDAHIAAGFTQEQALILSQKLLLV